jgi:outer membrane protein
MTAHPRVWLLSSLVVCLVAAPGALEAQGHAPARPAAEPLVVPLTLADVVRRALRDDPDIMMSERAADAAYGAATSSRAAYDATVQTSIGHTRDNGLKLVSATVPGGDPTIQSVLTSSVASGIAVQQRLRWGGVILSPQLALTGAGVPGTIMQSRANVALGVRVPFARDRGGDLVRSAEAAAYTEAEATVRDVRQAAATGVLQAVNSYWGYVAAQRRLRVFVAGEERARKNLAQTTDLVAADERPASDLVQLRGNVASKVAARISAEQSVLETWRTLSLVVGLGGTDIAAVPASATDLPAFPDTVVLREMSATDLRALVDGALARRADLAAAAIRVREGELGVRTTTHLMRPIIDVVAQVGYSGLDQGSGVQHYLSPAVRNWSPLNATLQLVYQFSAAGSDAAGRSQQTAAALDQERIAHAAVERSIVTGVVVAVDGLRRSIASGASSRVASQAAEQAVTNELSKFRLGSSTVIDVILAEDGLTNAMLNDVSSRQSYAVAIARLQFELGTLVTGESQTLTGNIASLLEAPAVIAKP